MSRQSQPTSNHTAGYAALLAFDILLALFLAFSVSAETLMDYTGDIRSLYPANFIAAPTPATYALFAGSFAVATIALRLLRQRLGAGKHARGLPQPNGTLSAYFKGHSRTFLGTTAALALCWIALLLEFWPGTSMNDQLSIIAQPVVSGGTHPLIYNLALSLSVRASLALCGSGNPGFAFFVIAQILTCSAIVSFCCQWLRYHGARPVAVALVVAFLALAPIVAMFSVNAWKDTLFGYVMLLWLPYTWEASACPAAFWHNRRNYLLLGALVVGTALLRNNGLMLAFAFSLVLLALHRRQVDLKLGAGCLAATFVLCLLPSAALSTVGVHQLTREVVNIPLQQLSAVQVTEKSKLSSDSRHYIDDLLPSDKVAGSYMPVFADGIKFMGWFDPEYTLDATQDQFAQVYLDALCSNPDTMLRAYLSHTYGNWSLLAFSTEQSFELALSANIPGGEFAQLKEEYGLDNHSLYPQAVHEWFTTTYPHLLLFPGPGACFALVLLLGYALTLRMRRAWPLLLILPQALLWCTLMLASPLSLALRYVFPMVCAIPFLAAALSLPRR